MKENICKNYNTPSVITLIISTTYIQRVT